MDAKIIYSIVEEMLRNASEGKLTEVARRRIMIRHKIHRLETRTIYLTAIGDLLSERITQKILFLADDGRNIENAIRCILEYYHMNTELNFDFYAEKISKKLKIKTPRSSFQAINA